MATVDSIKEKVIEYMNSVDLSALSMQELNTYVFTLNTLATMDKTDYMDALLKMASGGFASGKVEEKEE